MGGNSKRSSRRKRKTPSQAKRARRALDVENELYAREQDLELQSGDSETSSESGSESDEESDRENRNPTNNTDPADKSNEAKQSARDSFWGYTLAIPGSKDFKCKWCKKKMRGISRFK